MSIPSNPLNGDIISFGGSQYQYDSLSNRWIIIRSKDVIELENRFDSDIQNVRLNDLVDVSITYPPDHNTIMSWDSDNNGWKARQFTMDPLGAIAYKNEKFTPTTGQSVFRLTHYPIGDVEFIRNGVKLIIDCYSVNGKEVTYDYTQNGYHEISSVDEIIISYNYGTSIALSAELADLTDVDVTSVLPRQGEVLTWDSDNSVFAPSNALKEDIDQFVADRVYSDNLLSNRINDLDSDLNARGSFYVQATAPTGSANSGWVNTTNMRLHVWDVTSDTWVEVTLT